MMSIPATLRDAITAGTCIPFVGAGVSMSVMKRESPDRLFPNWRELLLACADRLQAEQKPNDAALVRTLLAVDPAQYLPAAKHAHASLGPVWYHLLAEQLDQPWEAADPGTLDIPASLWRLNSRLLVTTNFDRVLHWACPNFKDIQTWDIQAPAKMPRIPEDLRRPTVWHLHGCIDNPSEMVLTPDGFNLLYPTPAVESHYSAALSSLHRLIASRTLLFVGWSGSDSYVCAQLQLIAQRFHGASGPHYILLHKDDAERFRSLGLPLQPVLFEDHGTGLGKLLEQLAAAPEEAEKAKTAKRRQPTAVKGAPRTPAPPDERPFERMTGPAGFVMGLTDLATWDDGIVGSFRSQMRPDAGTTAPSTLPQVEFLESVGCLREGRLTIAGALMFTRSPSGMAANWVPSAVTQCVVYSGGERSAERRRERCQGPVLDQMIRARDFVVNHTPQFEMPSESSMRASVEYQFPMVCVREVIANALCHRDYSDATRMTYIRIFDDRIEVSNPGRWMNEETYREGPVGLDKLASQSIQANMGLAHLVSMVNVVEMEGSGIHASMADCERKGAPIPTVMEKDGYVTVTIAPRAGWQKDAGRRLALSNDKQELEEALRAAARAGRASDPDAEFKAVVRATEIYLRAKSYDSALESAQRSFDLAKQLHDHKKMDLAMFHLLKAKDMRARTAGH